jgi:mannose-6-phosphate isomerase-like protein (cupin superfamily)
MKRTRIRRPRAREIGAGPPMHVHDREDECLDALDGELSTHFGDDALDAAAGSLGFLPRGRPHRFWAAGLPARLLVLAVPGGIEEYFAEIDAAPDDAAGRRIGERYGVGVAPR